MSILNQYSFVFFILLILGILAQKYGFQATPTFIMFDSQGVEEWRSLGRIDRDKVQQFMESYR